MTIHGVGNRGVVSVFIYVYASLLSPFSPFCLHLAFRPRLLGTYVLRRSNFPSQSCDHPTSKFHPSKPPRQASTLHHTYIWFLPALHVTTQVFHPIFTTTMFVGSGKTCVYCKRPLSFGLYRFCCNNCQRCYHRERGTSPTIWPKEDFRKFCREHRADLDAHARDVALHGPNHHSHT